MGGLSIECERARLSASLATDAELTELERASLDAHLRGCAACAAYAVELGEIARLVREAPAAEPARPLVVTGRRRRYGRLHLAASAAAVVAALAFGSLAGTLSSGTPAAAPRQGAAAHRLLIEQSLLALMAGSTDASRSGGRLIPS